MRENGGKEILSRVRREGGSEGARMEKSEAAFFGGWRVRKHFKVQFLWREGGRKVERKEG